MSRTRHAAMERKIGAIWAEVLNCDAVAADGDFFELGGDSIMALNMLFEVGAALGIELPPGALFENPTLQGFTAAVAQARDAERSLGDGQEGDI